MAKTTAVVEPATEPTTPTTTVKSKTGKATPKSKTALGVPESHTIVWVPFDLAPDDHALVSTIVKGRKIETRELLVPALREWLDDHRDELTAEAEEYATKTEMTPEQIAAKIAAAQRQIERMNAMLTKHGNQ